MKIAPYTEGWNEGQRDWSFVRDPRIAIEAWETREGIHLPEDYRKFMLQFNGGYVYPRIFRHNIPKTAMPLGNDEMPVDPIYDWRTVEGHWRGETYGLGIPPRHLAIAGTPGSLELLMALDDPNFGSIFAWVQSGSIYGTDTNVEIYPQAGGFTEFLMSLHDDAERSDHDAWHLPIFDKLAKELQI
jgi:hypothetical protein